MMNPEFLEPDEFLYELFIRGMDTTESEDKQKRNLRQALRDEGKEARSVTFHDISGINPNKEIEVCSKKISGLSELCIGLIIRKEVKRLDVALSRLFHLRYRLQRL